MNRAILLTIREYEQALRAEFEAEGHTVVDRDGIHYARIVDQAEDGGIILTEINISRIAISLERRLS